MANARVERLIFKKNRKEAKYMVVYVFVAIDAHE